MWRCSRAAPPLVARRGAPQLLLPRRGKSSTPIDGGVGGAAAAKGSTKKKKYDTPQFGKQHAGDESAAAQTMHDIGRGRYEYLGDFVSSMNKGPVKVEFGREAKPISEKQKALDEVNERNLKMIQRSLVLGSVLAGASCFVGWQITKWYYGVKSIAEFGEVMGQRMPKVSGSLEDSMVGRKLKDASEHSREAISEDKNLTDWRRSLRAKFNSEEGAALARQNSMMLKERREAEKIARKSKPANASAFGSTTAQKETSAAPLDADEAALAAAVASVEASGDTASADDSPGLVRSTSRVLMSGASRIGRKVSSMVSTKPKEEEAPSEAVVQSEALVDSAAAASSTASADDSPGLVRSTSRVLMSGASRIGRKVSSMVSGLPPP